MRKTILLLMIAFFFVSISASADSILTNRGFQSGLCYKHTGFISCAPQPKSSQCTLTLFPDSNGALTLDISKKSLFFISKEIKKGQYVLARFKLQKNKSASTTVIKILNINPISKDVFLALRSSENFLANKVPCK